MSSDKDFKETLINSGHFRNIRGTSRYTCQCPYCDDDHRHMYVLIDLYSDIPVLYKCFKCNSQGRMNKEFLAYFGLDTLKIPKSSGKRRIERSGVATDFAVSVTENDDVCGVSNYINERVGVFPTLQELQEFRYVGDPVGYVHSYLNEDSINTLQNRFWFQMTNGNLIGRWFNDNTRRRWLKYKTNNLKNQAGLHIIKNQIDLYKTLNVCISEGVMDSIGLYYHGDIDNGVYISCMGSDYESGLLYLVSIGIFGKGVNIKIFIDNDVNHANISPVVKKLFGRFAVYHNTKGHDFGLPADQIEFEKILT